MNMKCLTYLVAVAYLMASTLFAQGKRKFELEVESFNLLAKQFF